MRETFELMLSAGFIPLFISFLETMELIALVFVLGAMLTIMKGLIWSQDLL